MKKLVSYGSVTLLTLLLTSCFGSKKLVEYSVTSGDENLQALSKITENENATIVDVKGGYGSDMLLISVMQKAHPNYINIFKKENPLSPAMVEVTSGNNYNFDPFFCKETNRIAYSRSVAGGGRDIFMSELSGQALTPITETSGINEFCPSMSADGKLVVYQSGNGSAGEIWVKNLTTGEKLLLGKGCNPMISPDGTRIVFSRFSTPSVAGIWVMNVDGSNAVQLSTGKKELAYNPSWSPDGNRIVYEAFDVANNKKTFDIWIMNADGTGLIQVTTNDSNDRFPYWSKDGYIYFVSDRGAKQGDNQLWRFSVAGL